MLRFRCIIDHLFWFPRAGKKTHKTQSQGRLKQLEGTPCHLTLAPFVPPSTKPGVAPKHHWVIQKLNQNKLLKSFTIPAAGACGNCSSHLNFEDNYLCKKVDQPELKNIYFTHKYGDLSVGMRIGEGFLFQRKQVNLGRDFFLLLFFFCLVFRPHHAQG